MYVREPNPLTLKFLRVDDGPLLERVYELRYQVYCVSRRFLQPENYPAERETDDFDAHSVHFAALDCFGHVVGTARLVSNSKIGLPLDRYLPELGVHYLHGVQRRHLAEISRLAVRPSACISSSSQGGQAQIRRSGVALGLYREIYQASRELGLSHLVAAMERPLGRLLARYSLPFRAIGPEIDYYGPVRPYLLDIAQGERALHQRCPRMFARFAQGLPTDLQPSWYSRFADRSDEHGGDSLLVAHGSSD